jgi:hypothetical protein
MSHFSIRPAALVVVSNCHAFVSSLIENFVAAPAMSADAVTLVPDHVLTADPKISFFVTSFTVWVETEVLLYWL